MITHPRYTHKAYSNHNLLVAVLIIIAIFVGIIFSPLILSSYWDEIAQYRIGEYNFNKYVSLFDGIFGTSFADPAYADFDNFVDNDYGSVFEVLIAAVGHLAYKVFPVFDLSYLIVLKHTAVYMVFLLGTSGVYYMAKRRTGSFYGGLTAALVFFLSPRLFGNAFYNSKDIVFLSFFALSVNYILLTADRFRISSLFLAAFFTALATSARIIGIFSLFFGAFVFFVDWYRSGWSLRKTTAAVGCFCGLTLLLIYISYPYLWPSPFSRIYDVIKTMSKFSRHPDIGFVDGERIRTSLSWSYLTLWVSITLPYTFIALALCGSLKGIALIIRRTCMLSLWQNSKELCDYATTGLGIAPIIVSLFIHPWLYNGWRHFYFLMPFLSVATAVGIYFLASIFVNSKARSFIKMWFAAVVVFESLVGLIMYFPYPNCYFNTAAGANVIERYDFDYAETSAYDALVKILSYQKNMSKPISIAADDMDLRQVSPRLGQADKMVSFTEKVMPDYVISSLPEKTEIERQLYDEVSVITTLGGEVVLRILVPNGKRDSFCKANAEKCKI